MARGLVVGGGIVGLATAWALAKQGHSVVVCEKESDWSQHQSGRNSGVVHSGLYYAPGSLKATMAVRAAEELADFCAEFDIPYERTGKLVVATSQAQLPRLDDLEQRGRANGVPLRRVSGAEAREIEPELTCLEGLWVESTGICDYPAMAQKLAAMLIEQGHDLRLSTEVLGLRRHGDGAQVLTRSPQGTTEIFTVDVVAQCGGLYSDRLARSAEAQGGAKAPDVQIVPFRGEYFELVPERAHLVKGLIYPVPDPDLPFLGVHLTKGIHGDVHVGPNAVLALAREGYRWRDISPRDLAETLTFKGTWGVARQFGKYGVGEAARSLIPALFIKAVQQMVPAIQPEDLVRARAGVRAQAVRPDGTLCHDFEMHRDGPILHVLNAPSPAATASLLIGEAIAAELIAASASV